MNLNRRLLLALTVAAVLLLAMSAATWRSLAAPYADDPATAPRQGDRPQGATPALAAVPGGPGFVTQSGYLFKPVDPSYEWDYYNSEVYNPSDTTTGEYAGPLSLPHGATVTKFVAWYYDMEEGYDLTVTLKRAVLSGGQETMASVDSSAGGPHYAEDVSIDHAQIDLQSYAYYAYLTIPGGAGADLTLAGIRVDYEYPGYVPLAMNDR